MSEDKKTQPGDSWVERQASPTIYHEHVWSRHISKFVTLHEKNDCAAVLVPD